MADQTSDRFNAELASFCVTAGEYLDSQIGEALIIKIPETIRVGGFDYKIAFPEKIEDDCGEHWGHWNHLPPVIQISQGADEERTSATFIHEILHAIDDTILGGKLEEQDVKNLEAGFHQAMEQLGVRFVR